MTTATRQKGQPRKHRPNLELIGLRLNEGLSREALGYRIGVSRETIRMAEAGFVPTVRVQFALAATFKKRPLDLWPIEKQKAALPPKKSRKDEPEALAA